MQLRNTVLVMLLIGVLFGSGGSAGTSEEVSRVGKQTTGTKADQLLDVNEHPEIGESNAHCEEPASLVEPSCDMLVRRILASVVRYEIFIPENDDSDRFVSSLGHGTVKDGRYLVVHNHFGVDLSEFEDGDSGALITMHNGFGDLFLWDYSPRLTVVVEESEALVVDFGKNEDGRGFFDSLGIQSALFESVDDAAALSGQSVAQVVWEGNRSNLVWTWVDEVLLDGGTPTLVLANTLLHGASGGGVFHHGSHIAVNWQRGKHLDDVGEIIEEFSTAALNSSDLVDVRS